MTGLCTWDISYINQTKFKGRHIIYNEAIVKPTLYCINLITHYAWHVSSMREPNKTLCMMLQATVSLFHFGTISTSSTNYLQEAFVIIVEHQTEQNLHISDSEFRNDTQQNNKVFHIC